MAPNIKDIKRAVLLMADNSDSSGLYEEVIIETWVGIDHKRGCAQCSDFVPQHGVF